MPDPISIQNVSLGGYYDPEANACVAAPLPAAASTTASSTAAPTADARPNAMAPGAQQLVESFKSQADCDVSALKAAIACGQGVASALSASGTGAGAIVAGYFGGLQCSVAALEAYDCYKNLP
jgi:hypothetical protein